MLPERCLRVLMRWPRAAWRRSLLGQRCGRSCPAFSRSSAGGALAPVHVMSFVHRAASLGHDLAESQGYIAGSYVHSESLPLHAWSRARSRCSHGRVLTRPQRCEVQEVNCGSIGVPHSRRTCPRSGRTSSALHHLLSPIAPRS
jgi:hypothetical protein